MTERRLHSKPSYLSRTVIADPTTRDYVRVVIFFLVIAAICIGAFWRAM